jgi:hypothetical protein
VKHGFNNFAVRARQNLPEYRAGNLHKKIFAVGPVQAGGLKPGRVGVDAHAGLHMFKKTIPRIRRRNHRKRKSLPAISTDVHNLWKAGFPVFSSVFGIQRPRGGIVLSPSATRAALRELSAPRTAVWNSAGLSPIEEHGASEKCAKP